MTARLHAERPPSISVLLMLLILAQITPNTNARIARAQEVGGLVARFEMATSGLELSRQTDKGSFAGVLGRRSAVFGYENEAFEAWTYPLKLLKDFELSFQVEDYPLDVPGPDAMTRIEVRPEATTLVYTHAAFTVRQIIFAPVDESAIVMLLDIDCVRPLTITGSFRPDLKLMWPAGLMTGNLGWDETNDRYFIIEETNRFAGVVGAPGSRDISVMPYQEEPRDVPTRFVLDIDPQTASRYLYPIVIAGSVEGRADAEATFDRVLTGAADAYQRTANYYRDLLARTTTVVTPDVRLNVALDWARIGIDKGFVDNPTLGSGLVAGFRTSGASERPGFAWYFGRDALWTVFALTSTGNFEDARDALDFLHGVQRDDGRIPHEVSQSASYIPWFENYHYAWASADATPLYIIAHADLWRAVGDDNYLRQNWPSIKAAFRFSASTDSDNNNLIDNTNVGHAWIEGGELYGAHEEIYLQGLWIQAASDIAELAIVMGDPELAAAASGVAERTRIATEVTYWRGDLGFYDVGTPRPGTTEDFREDTVLPAVPLWWHILDDARAQSQIDHIGSGAMATDWGTRILSERSRRYDPLSYHNGSVWGLFTGWASMGAYRYGRPHVGLQALMANALLTYQDALGYVTELLSGQYNTAFGRSSHHQVWSEAMVTTPAVRGLLGLEADMGAERLRFEPQLPVNWDFVEAHAVRVGDALLHIRLERDADQTRIRFERTGINVLPALYVAPAWPLDTEVTAAILDGVTVDFVAEQRGDIQRGVVEINAGRDRAELVYRHNGGTSVYLHHHESVPGDINRGLRILRSRAMADALELVLEGLAGESYDLFVRSHRAVGSVPGVATEVADSGDTRVRVTFEGDRGYVRRKLSLPLN